MTNASSVNSNELATSHVSISFEALAYVVIISLSLVLRIIALGDTPLSQSESREALAALRALSSAPQSTGSVDSIIVFGGTVLSFAVATPSNTAARFFPSFIGILLILSPLVFRRQLGRVPTLIAAALLAASPTAVVTSRELTGTGITILCVLLVIWLTRQFMVTRKPAYVTAAGATFALALLADFAALLVAVAIALGVAFARITDEEGEMSPEILHEWWDAVPLKNLIAGFVLSIAAFGTLFFLTPAGLGTIGNQLSRFLGGTITRSASSPYVGIVLTVYESVILAFGLLGAWLASQSANPWYRILAGWGVAAVLLSFLYQGLLPEHTLWVVVPLAALAALAVYHLLRLEHDAPAWAIAVYVAALIGSLAMIYLRVAHQLRVPSLFPIATGPAADQPGINLPIDLIWITIGIVLVALLWLAVASFWEPRAAWQGLGLAVIIPGIVLMIGQSGELAYVQAQSPYELFHTSSPQQGLEQLVQTATEISEIATGNPRDAVITVQGDPDGVLAWSISSFNYVTYVSSPNPDIQSAMVITPADGTSPFLGSNYVGQDFVIESSWDSTQLDPSQAVGWFLFRTASHPPVVTERVILWVREDIYSLVPQRDAR